MAILRDCLQTNAVLLGVTDDIQIFVLMQGRYLS